MPIKDTENLSDKVKDAEKRLEEVNQMYIQLKEDVNQGFGDNDANIRKKIAQIEKYHEEVKAINLKEGVRPDDAGLKSIEDVFKIFSILFNFSLIPPLANRLIEEINLGALF